MKQDFETAELKAELERSLGFAFRSLERLDGACPLNFKAVRASDGMTFAGGETLALPVPRGFAITSIVIYTGRYEKLYRIVLIGIIWYNSFVLG